MICLISIWFSCQYYSNTFTIITVFFTYFLLISLFWNHVLNHKKIKHLQEKKVPWTPFFPQPTKRWETTWWLWQMISPRVEILKIEPVTNRPSGSPHSSLVVRVERSQGRKKKCQLTAVDAEWCNRFQPWAAAASRSIESLRYVGADLRLSIVNFGCC